MLKLIIPALIALLSVAHFADHASAQDSMSDEKRDALIGRLENVLQELQAERSMASSEATHASEANVAEGSLSANRSVGSLGSYSNMGAYDGYGTNSYNTQSRPVMGQSYGYGSLPVQGYATGQSYAAPVVQAAPVYQAAPMTYAAPVQQAPVVTSMGPLPDLTLPPINITEPAPTIIVQQAPPAPTFQPVFMMNYVPPMPMPQPRRHKCCLFGR